MISDKIFAILKEQKMSQKDFSKATGIAESTISDWKRKGNIPSADKILSICSVLGISPYELLSESAMTEYSVNDAVRGRDYLMESYSNMDEAQQLRLMEYAKGLTGQAEIVGTDKVRRFNSEGVCVPRLHYMVDLSDRIRRIDEELIIPGKYFTINRARQYGKTTLLYQLESFLKAKYIVISISFEAADDLFASRASFAKGLIKKMSDELRTQDINADILAVLNDSFDADFPLEVLKEKIISLCKLANRPVILMIDEVDRSSDNAIFLSFLGLLRNMYLSMQSGKIKSFHSVVLAGVYDIKNLKLKLRPQDEQKYNSPWNIAADFDIDMSFSAEEISGMLLDYKQQTGAKLDYKLLGQRIYDYTAGYPYLVSRLCKKMQDEQVWTEQLLRDAVRDLVKEKNTLFDDIGKKISAAPELKQIIYDILFKGAAYPFAIENEYVSLGVMFGFLTENEGQIAVANRIFEIWFYNLFIAEDAINNRTYSAGMINKSQFIDANGINMKLILEKFVEHFTEIYADNDYAFVEENGRRLFLLYIRPVINGVGNYYIESRTRSMGRTDVIIDYLGKRYVIELKIWRGEEYNRRGEEQLIGYLEDYKVKTGYMVSFNFNKNKQCGVKELHFDKHTLIEAVC